MTPEQQELANHETECACDACKASRGDKHGIISAPVRNYSFRPREWKQLSLRDDTFPYHLGVELETSTNPNSSNVLWQEQAVGLRRPKSLWFAKYDASVTGPEFVSHPATLSYWHDKAAELTEMFRLLIHAGYRSHNGGRAGMHVNISKDAFSNDKHLHRFLTFLYVNQWWAHEVSQRTSGGANEWAATTSYTLEYAEQMLSRHSYAPVGKYSVVYSPDYSQRLEFRLPRGTLRVDRFYKNLEWTAAMIAYTRHNDYAAHNELYARTFVSWVFGYPTVYENLKSFFMEKDDVLQEAMTNDIRHRNTRMADCGYDPCDQADVFGPPKPSPEELRRAQWDRRWRTPPIYTYSSTSTSSTYTY
jgi:hypothetical protein